MRGSLLLLKNFLENPMEIGAVAPSSKFLTREIMNNVDFKSAKTIVELGPGSGVFTKSILKKASPDARVFCLEVNKKFCDHLKNNIFDKRLTVINLPAEDLSKLKKFGISKADCIVSGIPFLNFPKNKKIQILSQVGSMLNADGKFILFQYTNGLIRLLESYFSKVERKFVALNIPPSFVYICGK